MKVALERVPIADLTAQQIAAADAVVLAGVGQVSPEIVEALVRFVEHGGGVLLSGGESVFEDDFNDTLAALSPARLARRFDATQRDRADWEYDAPHRQIEKTFTHPLLRHYLSEAEGSIENVRIYNYFRLVDPPAALMTLDNGDPLLLERNLGRGKVLLLTSSLGGAWSTFPVRNMYANFVYAWLTYLCSFRDLDRNLEVGEPWILDAAQPDLRVAAPDASAASEPLVEKAVDGRKFYRYDALATAGKYRLVSAAGEFESVTVRAPLVESNTLGLADRERGKFEDQLGCRVVREWNSMADVLSAEEHRGIDLAGVPMLLILLLILLDGVLTRVWFR
jgi:hypothetical protein